MYSVTYTNLNVCELLLNSSSSSLILHTFMQNLVDDSVGVVNTNVCHKWNEQVVRKTKCVKLWNYEVSFVRAWGCSLRDKQFTTTSQVTRSGHESAISRYIQQEKFKDQGLCISVLKGFDIKPVFGSTGGFLLLKTDFASRLSPSVSSRWICWVFYIML